MFALKYFLKEPYKILSNPDYRELLKLMWQLGDEKRYVSRTANFKGVKFHLPDCMSFLFQFKEIFVDNSYKFATSSKQPLIIDCGANTGTSCVFFKKTYPSAKIIAFEADPKIAKILKENITNNNIEDIIIIPKAVWIDNLGIEFATEGSDGASIYGAGEKTKVETVRLKEILEKYQVIDMLKIDIEGAEYEVIKDCSNSLSNVSNVFIEYHSFPNQAQKLGELLEILTENGFSYYINSPNDRPSPFINHQYKGNQSMDLQLNIFGYRK